MKIQTNNNYNTSFTSASDITIKYALEKHSDILPSRIKKEIQSILSESGENLPKLYELHNRVYQRLFNAQSMEEVREHYPEYKDIIELTALAGNRSKAVKAVKLKGISLEDFTLDFIKKLFAPTPQETLVKEYGFTNRSLIIWLMEKLDIPKFNGNYINILRMSDEVENSRIAELSRQAIYRMPEVQQARQAKVTAHHRTPEYREKKRREMIEFYKNNPDMAERVSKLSKLNWDKCPEIKEALSIYTVKSPEYVKNASRKKQRGQKLTEEEKQIISGYFRSFWKKHPEFVELYSKMRAQAAKELGYSKK